jgi:peptidoglycan/xylan/chitin deacetylase (PgdA/CDA1 family)
VSSERTPANAPSSLLEPPPVVRRAGWRRAFASGLHRFGLLGVARRASSSWDLDRQRGIHFRRASRPKLAILCYHRVGTRGVPLYSALPPEVFDEQMHYLKKRYRMLSVAHLCDEVAQPRSKEPAVAVTFDDGYGDLARYAFPILQKYQIPATIFLAVEAIESGETLWYDRVFIILQVISGRTLELELDVPRQFRLGSPSERLEVAQEIMRTLRTLPDAQRRRCCAELESRVVLPSSALSGRMLTWDEVRTMHRAGISFGSHTMSHRVVGRLQPEEARHELLESRRIIEDRLGHPVDTFAFPFGQPADIGSVTDNTMRECGYRCAMTTVEGINDPGANPFRLLRTQIGEEQSLPMFAWKLNLLFLNGARRDSFPLPSEGVPVSKECSSVEVGHA